jgi:PiT family inorganic phosphate transporter
MTASLMFILFIILLALAFDFLNGFHDAANSIATIVSTQVLKPYQAVIWAASFNFMAFIFFKLHVATTIGSGLIDPSVIDPTVICTALTAAIFWNIATWYYGLPASSSHALIGGLIGAGVTKAGIHSLNIIGISKILASIALSPLLGFILGLIMMFVTARLFFHTTPIRVNAMFKRLQLASSALISLGHGGNDAQKTMGIIAALLFSADLLKGDFYVPFWIVIACNSMMAMGTLFGGWRIVKTMGMKITKLRPVHGFCAETAGAATLLLATNLGIPVSTTHTITGAIMGVGSLQGVSAVRWGIVTSIVWAWIFTLPATALLAGLLWMLIQHSHAM